MRTSSCFAVVLSCLLAGCVSVGYAHHQLDQLAPYAPEAKAAISFLVSAAVAWLTARRKVRIELDKMKLAVQQKLLQQLVAARLAVYPELFFLLSDPQKDEDAFLSNLEYRRDLLAKINAWDSNHAILLGRHTVNVCYEFRQALAKAVNLTTTELTTQDTKGGSPALDVLRNAESLELALRSDLGIYGVDLRTGSLHLPDISDYETSDDAQQRARPWWLSLWSRSKQRERSAIVEHDPEEEKQP